MLYDPPMFQKLEEWEKDLSRFEKKVVEDPFAQKIVEFIKRQIEMIKSGEIGENL